MHATFQRFNSFGELASEERRRKRQWHEARAKALREEQERRDWRRRGGTSLKFTHSAPPKAWEGAQ
jgi:hypothetical protein